MVGLAQAHGVAGFVGRQDRGCDIDGLEHFRNRLAHGEASDGVPVEVEIDEVPGRLFPKIRETGPLDDAEIALSLGLVFRDPFPRPDAQR